MPTKDLPRSTHFRLRGIPPYNFLLTVRKPAGWPLLTPAEIFEGDTLWTAMMLNAEKIFGLKLRSTGTVERPEVSGRLYSSKEIGSEEKRSALNAIAWTLGLMDDLREFYALGKGDPIVSSLVSDLYGMRLTKRPDIFPSILVAVTLQMAPIRRSQQMMNLLIKNYGVRVRFDGRSVLYWPSPERIARTNVRDLKDKCKLGYRAKILKGIAQAVRRGFPTPSELVRMTPEEARAKLMELKGIGEYSADIVSPHPGFALDVWSAKIFNLLLFGEKAGSPRSVIPKLKKVAEGRWGKWRGHVFAYVLNDLDNLSRRFGLDLTKL